MIVAIIIFAGSACVFIFRYPGCIDNKEKIQEYVSLAACQAKILKKKVTNLPLLASFGLF